MELSKALKRCRKFKHITQKQAAAAAGVTESMYQFYEYGKNEPTARILIALADYFDVPLDYLVGRGLFKNWEEIMENKAFILPILQDELPFLKNIDLNDLDEQMLMRLLPTMVQKVDISGTGDDKKIELTLYPLYLK